MVYNIKYMKNKKLCTQCNINQRIVSPSGNETYLCKICQKVKSQKRYKEHKIRLNIASREWAKRNKKKAYAINKKSRIKRRLSSLQAYSSEIPFCSCCKEINIEFLTIDHTLGGGRKHRKELGDGGQTLYSWLKKNNYPKGFRVLCYNCNSCYGHYNYCPHQKLLN